MTKNYTGYEALISYLSKTVNCSYRGFLNLHRDTIVSSLTTASLTSDKWNGLDVTWSRRFLDMAEELLEQNTYAALKEKVNIERLRVKDLENYWKKIIAEREKKQDEFKEAASKIYNLRKRHNIDYNEERMTKKMNIKRQSVQSTQSIQFTSDTQSASDIDDNNKITDEQFAHFDYVFHNLDPEKMWTLKSGRIVEKVIYEYARKLKYESHLHSFIISDIDKEAKSLFQNEEWEEIFSSNCKTMPKINKSIIELMKKYSTTDLSLFRNIIFKPFLNTSITSYSKDYFDLNYINFAYRAMHILWEKNYDFTLDQSRLEGWYEHNIWSHLIDPVFHNLEIDLIRGEDMSLSSNDQKNNEKQNNEDQENFGRKGDGIFRSSKDRLGFGAIEAGRKWEGINGRNYIVDSLKLSKMLRDMLVGLITKCKGNEQIVRQLQTVGMLHSANRFQLLTMDIPKGYICRIQHLNFYEIAGRINDPPLAFVIKDIFRAKAIILQTFNLVQQETTSSLDSLDDSDDNNEVREKSKQHTTSRPITLPSNF